MWTPRAAKRANASFPSALKSTEPEAITGEVQSSSR